MVWVLGISCAILLLVIVFLLRKSYSANKAMVGSVVAALVAGAGGGSMINKGPVFVVDKGKNTKTIFMCDTDTDSMPNRPERTFVINRPIGDKSTFTLACWNDSVLTLDYAYKKETKTDSGYFTRALVTVIFEDTNLIEGVQ